MRGVPKATPAIARAVVHLLDGDMQKREIYYISPKVTFRAPGPRIGTVRAGLCQGAPPTPYLMYVEVDIARWRFLLRRGVTGASSCSNAG
jgi:hypothetical protein